MKLRTFGYALFIAVAAVALAIGSASTGEAKGKKKAAAPASHPEICIAQWQPVCGLKGGSKFTYANSCSAEKDGATVVSQKACPMKAMMGKKHKAKKAMKMKPAKAMKSDMKKPDAKAEKKKM